MGTVTSSDHDLIGNSSGNNLSNGDIGGDLVGYTAATLHLGPLANNGGPLAGRLARNKWCKPWPC